MSSYQTIIVPGVNPDTPSGFSSALSGLLDDGGRRGQLNTLLRNFLGGAPNIEDFFAKLRECARQGDQREIFAEYRSSLENELRRRRALLDGQLAELARIK